MSLIIKHRLLAAGDSAVQGPASHRYEHSVSEHPELS